MARQAEQDPTNLYIANLPHTIKENDLENMFSQYGRVSILLWFLEGAVTDKYNLFKWKDF